MTWPERVTENSFPSCGAVVFIAPFQTRICVCTIDSASLAFSVADVVYVGMIVHDD
jgi:hypothetical protein